MMPHTAEISPILPLDAARRAFPRGLEQPQGSLRFGSDALLLAAWAVRAVEAQGHPTTRHLSVVELGCGCGAALLGLALRCPQIMGLGVDVAAPLIQAAQHNAARLGLEMRLSFCCADITLKPHLHSLLCPGKDGAAQGQCDMVLANAPFDILGRRSPQALREMALRHPPQGLPSLHVFARAGAFLLRHHGYFVSMGLAAALPAVLGTLDAAGLGVRHILPLRPRYGKKASRVLVTARRDAAHDVCLDGPLTLHGRTTSHGSWTKAALRFCPWLA